MTNAGGAIGPVRVSYASGDALALAQLLAEITGGQALVAAVPHIAAMRLLTDATRAETFHTSARRVLVHEAQTIVTPRAIAPDVAMTAGGYRLQPSDDAATLTLTVTDTASATVAELEARLRYADPKVLAATRGRTAQSAEMAGSAALSAAFTQAHVERYAELSGDRNRLHLDSDLAHAAGLPGCVVHGMLLAGLSEGLLDVAQPAMRLTETRTRFLAPVFVGERVSVTLVERGISPTGARHARASVWLADGVLACVTAAVLEPR